MIESDSDLRERVAEGLRRSGVPVVAAARIAEVERWPVGEVVLTDLAHFTPFWKTVGATHVIVMVETNTEGMEACRGGASGWLLRSSSIDILLISLRATLAAEVSKPAPDLTAI